MKFTIVKDPIPYVVIDDLYSQEELNLIQREFDFTFSKLQGPEVTGSALRDGVILKNNKGVFLDDLYRYREFSDILRINRKIFSNEVAKELNKCNYSFQFSQHCNYDSTLISYYDNGDYYEPHTDICVITAVTWFHSSPKNFTGGDFIFSDYNITIEPRHNRCVIFFSFTKHAVSPTVLIDESKSASGRFAMSQFLSFEFKR